MSWKDYAQTGFVFSTFLMRANADKVYLNSLNNILHKSRLYLVSIGDEEGESFWMTGKELFTLYADKNGYRVLSGSYLGNLISNVISEEDAETLFKNYNSDKYRDVEDVFFNLSIPNKKEFINSLVNKSFYFISDIITYIKPLGEQINLYRVHTDQKPYYLEELQSYGSVKKNNRE